MKKFRWVAMLTGVLLIGLGIFVFANPAVTLVSLAIWAAVGMFVSGLYEIVGYFGTKKENRVTLVLISGIISMLLGISLVTSGLGELSLFVPTIFAFWILMSGITKVFLGIDANKYIERSGTVLIMLGIFGTIFGAILLNHPLLSAIMVIYLIAISLVYQGVAAIVLSFKLR